MVETPPLARRLDPLFFGMDQSISNPPSIFLGPNPFFLGMDPFIFSRLNPFLLDMDPLIHNQPTLCFDADLFLTNLDQFFAGHAVRRLRPERKYQDALQPARTARDDALSVRWTKSAGRTRSSSAWTCSAALADPPPRHGPVPRRH